MDANTLNTLALNTYQALQPYWPLFAAKAAETLGEKAPEAIGNLWTAVKERFARKPAAEETLRDLLKNPDDPDLQAAFRVQMKKLLEEDDAFAGQVARLVESAASHIESRADVKGDQNVVVQGAGNVVTVTASDAKKK